MLDESRVSPDQTHLGWRSLPADGHDGQDRLVLRGPYDQPAELASDEPLVTFLTEDTTSQEPAGAVEDASVEAPSFLWSSSNDDDTTVTPPGGMNDESNPLLVFSDQEAEQTASSDSATIFS